VAWDSLAVVSHLVTRSGPGIAQRLHCCYVSNLASYKLQLQVSLRHILLPRKGSAPMCILIR
jgi:hypothetical protein